MSPNKATKFDVTVQQHSANWRNYCSSGILLLCDLLLIVCTVFIFILYVSKKDAFCSKPLAIWLLVFGIVCLLPVLFHFCTFLPKTRCLKYKPGVIINMILGLALLGWLLVGAYYLLTSSKATCDRDLWNFCLASVVQTMVMVFLSIVMVAIIVVIQRRRRMPSEKPIEIP